MIIHRLTIRNYRGVDDASVDFSPRGITVIEGNNEVGKSSLIEGLRLLIEYPDNSSHRDIKAIKPTHRDEGPEIELNAESGPYAFTYLKRFHKKAKTTLTITSPSPENLTGREAHERVEQILRETMDLNLWKAVEVQQGTAVSQARFNGVESLAAALDKAAGSEPVGAEEASLLARAEQEFLKYFTPSGGEGKEQKYATAAVENIHAKVAEFESQAKRLETDTERLAAVKGEILKHEETVARLRTSEKESKENLEKVEKLEREIVNLDLKLQAAQLAHSAAQKALDDRRTLIQRIEEREKESQKLAEKVAGIDKKLEDADKVARETKQSLEDLGKQVAKTRDVRDQLKNDYDYFRDLHDLQTMKERKEEVDQARDRAAGAREVLAGTTVTEEILEAIVSAENKMNGAKAKLEVGAPSFTIKALKRQTIRVDGRGLKLDEGQEETRTVTEELNLLLPDLLNLKITAGSSSEGIRRKFNEAEEEFHRFCQTHGVKGSAEARKKLQAREEAESRIKYLKKVEKTCLRDLTYEDLTARIAVLQDKTDAYKKSRPKTSPMEDGLDAALEALKTAEGTLRKVNVDWSIADSEQKEAEIKQGNVRVEKASLSGNAAQMAKELDDSRKELISAQQNTSDAALQASLQNSLRTVVEKEGIIKLKRKDLAGLNPDRVRALMESVSGSLVAAEERHKKSEREAIELEARVKTLGDEGLHDKIEDLKSELYRAEREKQSLCRRAAAARLLYTLLKKERDAANESYKAPFKDKIEQLGRLVFDDTFQVEIDDDLAIKARTQQEITVPFDSLSGGAREQLSILARIAAAMLVSAEKPVPVILDDALGYTDPDRLRFMGAALAQAGKKGQVIILTCTPDRYTHLGQTKVVRL